MLYNSDLNNRLLSGVNTDFKCLRTGELFPPRNVVARNRRFKMEDKMFRGTYNDGVQLEITCTDAYNNLIKRTLPYTVLSVNKFKLFSDKLASLIFGVGDFDYKAANDEDTQLLRDLVEKTKWVDSIRKAFNIITKNDNCILRTNKYGANAIEPTNGFKIVDPHDKSVVKAVVLFEVIKVEKNEQLRDEYIRIELHCKGHVAERIYKYKYELGGGVLGEPVDFVYRGRLIKAEGLYYELPSEDMSMAEWLCVNDSSDPSGVYGMSAYWDFANLVFKLEEMLSVEGMVIETNAKPMLAVASKLIKPDEKTGGYKISKITDIGYDIIPVGQGEKAPEFISNANAQLEHSARLRDSLEGHIYELMEMNKSFLTGSYGGNVSDETLNTIMKGCVDKAERYWWSLYYGIKNSLYSLASLNGLNIPYSDIEVIANIGLNESKKELVEICSELIGNNILSKESIRIRYYGMNKEQSELEEQQIRKESGQVEDIGTV